MSDTTDDNITAQDNEAPTEEGQVTSEQGSDKSNSAEDEPEEPSSGSEGDGKDDEVQEQKDKPKKVKNEPHWYQNRINSLTSEKHQARQQAEVLEKQNKELLAQLASLKTKGADAIPNEELDKIVEIKATQKATQELQKMAYNQSLDKIWSDGTTEYKNFGQVVTSLHQLGELFESALPTISKMPDAHRLLTHLSKDLDAAAKIFELEPERRAIELARMDTTPKKPETHVSKAPAPIKPVEGVKRGGTDFSDPEISMNEFVRLRNADLQKKGRRLY